MTSSTGFIVSLNRVQDPLKDPGWTAGTSRSGGECGRTGGAVGPCFSAGPALRRLHAFREFVQHVQEAVIPASLFCRLRPDLRHSRPDSQVGISSGKPLLLLAGV